MCRILNCKDKKWDLCLKHAMLVDEIVEILYDEKYTKEKINNELSLFPVEKETVYFYDGNFISANSLYDLATKIKLPDYTSRDVLEGCAILLLDLDLSIKYIVFDHIYEYIQGLIKEKKLRVVY